MVELANIWVSFQANTGSHDGGQIMKHELPPLPYDYNALEPYYDEQTVRIHHDKHHAAYVTGLNTAEEKLAQARESGDFSVIQHWERQLAFHGSGNLLHTIFWNNMGPSKGSKPDAGLAAQINHDFGSFDAFQKQFNAAAAAIEGNGWAILAWSPDYSKLYIAAIENHQKQTIMGLQPLLVLDVWEHAYYLKFQNKRPDWIANWWSVVNWQDISKRFAEARKPSTTQP